MASSETSLPPGSQDTGTATGSPQFDGSSRNARTRPRTEPDKVAAVEALLGGQFGEEQGGAIEYEGDELDGDELEAPELGQFGRDADELEDGAASDEGGEDQEARGKPRTLAELAEVLDMDPAELYKLELNTGDGETVTLGALKDSYQEAEAARRESAERATSLDEREGALIQEQRLWAQLGDQLTQHMSPDQRQALAQRLAETHEREREAMYRAIPEFRDAAVFDAFRDEVSKLLGDYGFRGPEMALTDHRHVLMLRDMARMKKRLRDLTGFKPQPKMPKAVKSRPADSKGAQAQMVAKARGGSDGDKVNAIARLLGG